MFNRGQVSRAPAFASPNSNLHGPMGNRSFFISTNKKDEFPEINGNVSKELKGFLYKKDSPSNSKRLGIDDQVQLSKDFNVNLQGGIHRSDTMIKSRVSQNTPAHNTMLVPYTKPLAITWPKSADPYTVQGVHEYTAANIDTPTYVGYRESAPGRESTRKVYSALSPDLLSSTEGASYNLLSSALTPLSTRKRENRGEPSLLNEAIETAQRTHQEMYTFKIARADAPLDYADSVRVKGNTLYRDLDTILATACPYLTPGRQYMFTSLVSLAHALLTEQGITDTTIGFLIDWICNLDLRMLVSIQKNMQKGTLLRQDKNESLIVPSPTYMSELEEHCILARKDKVVYVTASLVG